MKQQEHVVFREVQRPQQIWVWMLILGIATLMWYGFIQQFILDIPFGDKPASNGVLIVLWLFFLDYLSCINAWSIETDHLDP